MQYNVSQLLQKPIGSTRRYTLDEDIRGLDPELVPVTPLTGEVELLRIHSGVLVTGDLTVTVEMTCSRCLRPVAIQAQVHLEESFRPLTDVVTGRFIPPQEYEGTEEELMDAALLIDDHHILNIGEIVRQNIWLSLPMYPTCTGEAAESCLAIAAELQKAEEASQEGIQSNGSEAPEVDPRWAALLALRDKLDEA